MNFCKTIFQNFLVKIVIKNLCVNIDAFSRRNDSFIFLQKKTLGRKSIKKIKINILIMINLNQITLGYVVSKHSIFIYCWVYIASKLFARSTVCPKLNFLTYGLQCPLLFFWYYMLFVIIIYFYFFIAVYFFLNYSLK